MTTAQILSYGGGVQSVTMCLLVAQGRLPQPDRIVIADTGREAGTTWEYLDAHVQPLLAEHGLAVEILPHSLSSHDLYAKSGALLLPVWTDTGILPGYCSGEWKRDVVYRWLSRQGIHQSVHWIGYSLDERQRVREDKKRPRAYPLLDLMLTRSDCERLIAEAGLPLPRKSACWMCPHRTNAQWRDVRDRHDEWAAACNLDVALREEADLGGLPAVWLHPSRVPLAEADIDADDRRPPSRQCGLGMCFL